MIKYFCDNCGKELDEKEVKKVFNPNTMGEIEFCGNCEKTYNEATKIIEQKAKEIKEDAIRKIDEIRKEEMQKHNKKIKWKKG